MQNKDPSNGFFFVLLLNSFVSSGAGWKGHSERRNLLSNSTKHGRCWNISDIFAAVGSKPSMWHSKNVQILTVQFMSLLLYVPQTGNFSVTARERKASSLSCSTICAIVISRGSAVIDIVPVWMYCTTSPLYISFQWRTSRCSVKEANVCILVCKWRNSSMYDIQLPSF